MSTARWVGLTVGALALLNAPFITGATSTSVGTVQIYLILSDQGAMHHQLSDFTIVVNGQNPSQTGFSGSQVGQVVSLGSGPFSVTAVGPVGVTPSYSAGCAGTMQQYEAATCIISDSASTYSSVTPTAYNCSQYGGGYNCNLSYLSLACSPANQTIGVGDTASFSATGGSGVYSWATPDRNYIGIGSKLNTQLSTVGNQIITVSSNGQTATCKVNVTATAPGGTTVSSTYVPKLPNTGFAPTNPISIVLTLVMLIGFGFAFAPYVRQAFTATWR